MLGTGKHCVSSAMTAKKQRIENVNQAKRISGDG